MLFFKYTYYIINYYKNNNYNDFVKMYLFIFLLSSLLLFIYETNGLSCETRYDCLSVTKQLQYVKCVSSQCECLLIDGFSGNATITNKCRCLAPSRVYWKDYENPLCEEKIQ
jgi:hypothetical protein